MLPALPLLAHAGERLRIGIIPVTGTSGMLREDLRAAPVRLPKPLPAPSDGSPA